MVFRNPKVGIFFLITNTVSRIYIFRCGRAGFLSLFLTNILKQFADMSQNNFSSFDRLYALKPKNPT